MAGLNKVLLIGNLTRDSELRYIKSGMPVLEFRLAVSRKFRTASGEEREETLFIDVNLWGKRGEAVGKFLTKGKTILVEGRLKLEEWERDGQRNSKISVVAENIEFLGGGRNGGNGGGYGQARGGHGQGRPEPQPPADMDYPQGGGYGGGYQAPQQGGGYPAGGGEHGGYQGAAGAPEHGGYQGAPGGGPMGGQEPGGYQPPPGGERGGYPAPAPAATPAGSGVSGISDEEIPF